MSRIIAGIYEIQEEIGAGGGGVVYMGRHLRLEKKVVLKADKRTLSAGVEVLRREVDMLKELSHTYIPQVYDFVQEDGVVYTVMDYIEGESLDKLIGRGKLPAQPEVIKWACQLLEALCYLHSRPPHGILHGDIKPANIMLRPGGDVCLIDYNIALALGEEGAVKVGFSRGFASPEHYGADYISRNRPAAVGLLSEGKKGRSRGFTIRRAKASGSPVNVRENQTEALESVGKDKTEVLKSTREDKTEVLKFAREDKTEVLESAREFKTEVLKSTREDKTEVLESAREDGTEVLKPERDRRPEPSLSGNKTESGRSILLDVRSDLYSLGATLYYMLSGCRPAEDAWKVKPLGAEVCSLAVSDIIKKAMEPEPSMRYQSAEEMLEAFLQLHRMDWRVLRRKKRISVSAVLLTGVFLSGVCCSFIGLKQLEQMQKALALAEYSANSLAAGDVRSAVEQAMQAIPKESSILEAPVTAQAQKALTDALGVYDLSDGFKSFDTIELPGAPFHMTLSPDGDYLAVVYAYEMAVFETESREKIAALPVQNSALSDVVFADRTHIIYAGSQGVTVYDLITGKCLWTGEEATTLSVSADAKTVAAINGNDDKAIIYRISDGEKIAERSFDGLHMSVPVNDIFADPEADIFALNEDGSLLAVSFYNGGLFLFDLENSANDMIVYEESDYRHFAGGFYGKYFAYTAEKGGEAIFGLIDTESAVYVGQYTAPDQLRLRVDDRGIYLADGGLLVGLEPETMEEKELAYTENAKLTGFSVGEQYCLTATDDNCFSFYDSGANLSSTEKSSVNCDFLSIAGKYAVVGNRDEPFLRLMKLENHEEAQLLSYDARYEHDEARLSQDGQTVMLFSCQGFRIYDMNGDCIVEEVLPEAERIYDQQFVRTEEASWLETIWYDGTIRRYSAADGSLIEEKEGKPPERDLYEEFTTSQYRIASSLHEAPKVYDLSSDKLEAVLEEDSYLTYVTEIGSCLITEYISASGERYGFLLDQNFQKLAYLPGLCDIVDNMFIFDYESGNLRKCSLYSLPELIALGEEYKSSFS